MNSLLMRLDATTDHLEQATTVAGATEASRAELQQRLENLEQDHAGRQEEIQGVRAELDSTVADLAAAREQLDAFAENAGQADEQLRNALVQRSLAIQQFENDKNELEAQLHDARIALQEVQDKSQQDSSRVHRLEIEVQDVRQEIERLNEVVRSERETLDATKATMEGELEGERQGVEKAKAALEAAMRENKTLRSLARGAEADIEAYKNEISRELLLRKVSAPP